MPEPFVATCINTLHDAKKTSLCGSPPLSGMAAQQQSVEISVSTTFYPGATLPGVNQQSDLIVYTSDQVFFYVHRGVLLGRSTNQLGYHLRPDGTPLLATVQLPSSVEHPIPTLFIPEHSDTFNILLLMLYDMPCARYAPNFEAISGALAATKTYGIETLDPEADIWDVLIATATANPFRAYALAAAHGRDDVCVTISEFTLSVPLLSLTEEDADMMGSIYLRRLAFLHLGRKDALRRVLAMLLSDHEDTAECEEEQRRKFVLKWKASIGTILLQDLLPRISIEDLHTSLHPVISLAPCDTCKTTAQLHLSQMKNMLDNVKRTI